MGLSKSMPEYILNKIFENTYLTAIKAESKVVKKINDRFNLEINIPTYFD